MIEIIKVDSLKKKQRDKVLYEDLEVNSSFIWITFPNAGLTRKTDTGYLQEESGNHYPVSLEERSGTNKCEVIPVDARIEWAFREGAE